MRRIRREKKIKCALTSTMANATQMAVPDNTFAGTAKDLIPPPPVPAEVAKVAVTCKDGKKLSTPLKLNPTAFANGLACHPDRAFVKHVVNSCQYGINIGYEGPQLKHLHKSRPIHFCIPLDPSLPHVVKLGQLVHPISTNCD